MARRKKKEEEHENHERWLVSYADFITLLFALFVVLYGISSVDALKLQKMANSVQFAFSFHGKGGSDPVPLFPGPSQKSLSVTGPVLQDPSGDNADQDELQIIEAKLSGALRKSSENLKGLTLAGGGTGGDLFQTKLDHRGLVISLAAKYLFLPGQSEVRPELLPVIDTIALSLRSINRFVRVEGHTDNLPAAKEQHSSNWELSVSRATFIVRYMIQQWEFPPFMLCSAGYAEFRPVASNETEEGRASNRRVDIVVLSHKENRLEPPPYYALQTPGHPGYPPTERAFLEDFLSRRVP